MAASTTSRAVGPEPTSKAEPTAVGSVADPELLDCRKRAPPYPLTSCLRDFPSCPAFLSAFDVCCETGADVELVDPPLVFASLCVEVPLPAWCVALPPPPDPRHSL